MNRPSSNRTILNGTSLNGTSLNRIRREPRFWLQAIVIGLAVLNAVALLLYFDPPGGSRAALAEQNRQLTMAITAARGQALRLKRISSNVQLGSKQSLDFESRYIFPKRTAYGEVIAEIQRMAGAAKLTERDTAWTEEPIEGTADLTLLTNQANFEGSYSSLMQFLYLVDRSPKMLMLDTLTATPQKAGQVTAQVRLQAVAREETGPPSAGGEP